jgi:hypothetical protein
VSAALKPQTNVSSKKQVKAARLRAKFLRQQELNDTKNILATAWGRRFVWRYLGEAGVFHTSFRRECPHETSFNEGMRQVGLKLLADVMDADPEAYAKMTKEAQESEVDG